MQTAEQVIWRTVLYFSFFQYPVTAFEIWKWQYRPGTVLSLEEIHQWLAISPFLQERVETVGGFYGVGDVAAQIVERQSRYLDAVGKYKKAHRYLFYLSCIGSVRGVAFCNALPLHFTRAQSDIDMAVLTNRHAVWKTRFLSVLPLMLLRQRPGETTRNPLDVSFFLSTVAQNVRPLKTHPDDMYLAYWVAMLTPVYEHGRGIFERFLQENDWVQEELPNARLSERAPFVRRAFSYIHPLWFSEPVARLLQRWWFPKDIRSHANHDTRIMVSDDLLKFHKNDRRELIREYVQEHLV